MKSIGLAIFSTIVLFGCAEHRTGGETIVLKPVQATQTSFKFVNIIESEHAVAADADTKEHFRTTLSNMLYGTDDEPGTFKKGDGLTIKYRFLQAEKGKQFTRWLVGDASEGARGGLTVEVVFLDRTGAELGRIRAEGSVTAGAPFGGPWIFAIEFAAQEIAEYTEAHFTND